MVMVDLGDPEQGRIRSGAADGQNSASEDDDRIVPETTIMIEYLDRRHPGKVVLLPRDPEEELDARLWDRVFDLYVMDPMQHFIGQQLRPETERDARTIRGRVGGPGIRYDMIEKNFAARTWAARENFSIADCAAAPALFYAAIVAPFPSSDTNLSALLRTADGTAVGSARYQRGTALLQILPLNHAIPARFHSDNADAA